MNPSATDRGAALLVIARASIEAAWSRATPALPDEDWLRAPGASFVTLMQGGDLRGCLGTLAAHRPLGADVAANAQAAAFRDPRFAPLERVELVSTRIEVSVLSEAEPIPFADEEEALARLRPGVDGIVLECGGRRGTFLPQVWAQLPDPADFLAQLKRKAGLPSGYWDPTLRLHRYTVDKWAEPDLAESTAVERAWSGL